MIEHLRVAASHAAFEGRVELANGLPVLYGRTEREMIDLGIANVSLH